MRQLRLQFIVHVEIHMVCMEKLPTQTAMHLAQGIILKSVVEAGEIVFIKQVSMDPVLSSQVSECST